ncbi:integrin alpha-X-like [Ornithorhynchus anatinus]|uniref:integrin alpha-X-like n=1 Tax=Ornithorhynchus anatinus TaxID=9258 RepID=UPI0010A77616|nr:integrin alpha-X-like [Ornithorhynchus anatinus]
MDGPDEAEAAVGAEFGRLMFDTGRYAQFPGQEGFLTAQAKTVVERYEVYNTLPSSWAAPWGGWCCWPSSLLACTSLDSSSGSTRT